MGVVLNGTAGVGQLLARLWHCAARGCTKACDLVTSSDVAIARLHGLLHGRSWLLDVLRGEGRVGPLLLAGLVMLADWRRAERRPAAAAAVGP